MGVRWGISLTIHCLHSKSGELSSLLFTRAPRIFIPHARENFSPLSAATNLARRSVGPWRIDEFSSELIKSRPASGTRGEISPRDEGKLNSD